MAETTNKFKGVKKKLDDAKGLWAIKNHEVLWSYHTTPNSTTKETPFIMVYGVDVMLLVEIDMSSWRRSHFNAEETRHD